MQPILLFYLHKERLLLSKSDTHTLASNHILCNYYCENRQTILNTTFEANKKLRRRLGCLFLTWLWLKSILGSLIIWSWCLCTSTLSASDIPIRAWRCSQEMYVYVRESNNGINDVAAAIQDWLTIFSAFASAGSNLKGWLFVTIERLGIFLQHWRARIFRLMFVWCTKKLSF